MSVSSFSSSRTWWGGKTSVLCRAPARRDENLVRRNLSGWCGDRLWYIGRVVHAQIGPIAYAQRGSCGSARARTKRNMSSGTVSQLKDLWSANDQMAKIVEVMAGKADCVFHACRSMVSSHARPTFQLMSVQDFTACRSKTTRADGSCPKVLSASMIVDAVWS